ncbi:MAG: hypothetical protein NT094_00525, partial [Candidatus Staskawiczbacteria bacterium]|nr:hypothetical protein [Candidatus Staskawiczbacteria bacterium]
MAKKEKEREKKYKNYKDKNGNEEKPKDPILSNWAVRWIKAILLFLVSIITVLSFPYFNKAGGAGEFFANACDFLFGNAFYTIPLFLFVAGLIYLKSRKKGKKLSMAIAVLISLIGVAGILAVKDYGTVTCGWILCPTNNIGVRLAQLFVGLFGVLV